MPAGVMGRGSRVLIPADVMTQGPGFLLLQVSCPRVQGSYPCRCDDLGSMVLVHAGLKARVSRVIIPAGVMARGPGFLSLQV